MFLKKNIVLDATCDIGFIKKLSDLSRAKTSMAKSISDEHFYKNLT
jgi:hypothetical protein